jgi:hypothetical protein
MPSRGSSLATLLLDQRIWIGVTSSVRASNFEGGNPIEPNDPGLCFFKFSSLF